MDYLTSWKVKMLMFILTSSCFRFQSECKYGSCGHVLDKVGTPVKNACKLSLCWSGRRNICWNLNFDRVFKGISNEFSGIFETSTETETDRTTKQAIGNSDRALRPGILFMLYHLVLGGSLCTSTPRLVKLVITLQVFIFHCERIIWQRQIPCHTFPYKSEILWHLNFLDPHPWTLEDKPSCCWVCSRISK